MYLKLTTVVMLSLILPFVNSVWFAFITACNFKNDVTVDVTRQVWAIATGTMTGTTELTTSLSLVADGSLLALRDCDAYSGAQFLVGAGKGHCDNIIFSNITNDPQTGSVTSTIKLSWPENWCAGISVGGGPGVGVYNCNEATANTKWTARIYFGDSFTLELQEYPPNDPRQRRCLSAREWGDDTR